MIEDNMMNNDSLGEIGGTISDSILKGNESLLNRNHATDSFIASVISNQDEFKAGRVQVRIYGIHPESMPNEVLPWAMPADASTPGSGFTVPTVGSYVNISFEGNDINHPRWTNQAYTGSKSLPQGEFQSDYPNVIQILEFGDNRITFNRRTGSMKIVSGDGDSNITLTKSGSIIIDNTEATGLTGATKAAKDVLKDTVVGDAISAASRAKEAISGNGKPIVIRSMGRVVFRSPELMVDNDLGATVKPSLLGGPLNCVYMCPFAMIPHQGRTVTNLLNPIAEGTFEKSVMEKIEDGSELTEEVWDKLMDLKSKSPI